MVNPKWLVNKQNISIFILLRTTTTAAGTFPSLALLAIELRAFQIRLPEQISNADLTGTGVFPIWWLPARCLQIHNCNNLVITH